MWKNSKKENANMVKKTLEVIYDIQIVFNILICLKIDGINLKYKTKNEEHISINTIYFEIKDVLQDSYFKKWEVF